MRLREAKNILRRCNSEISTTTAKQDHHNVRRALLRAEDRALYNALQPAVRQLAHWCWIWISIINHLLHLDCSNQSCQSLAWSNMLNTVWSIFRASSRSSTFRLRIPRRWLGRSLSHEAASVAGSVFWYVIEHVQYFRCRFLLVATSRFFNAYWTQASWTHLGKCRSNEGVFFVPLNSEGLQLQLQNERNTFLFGIY